MQLLLLAAAAGGLQKKHKGQPQTQQLKPSAAGKIASSTTGSEQSGESQQHVTVSDCSSQLLQHLAVHEVLGQQLYEMFAPKFDGSALPLECIVRFAPALLACGASDRLFDRAESSKLPLLKVQLVSQVVALYPIEAIMPGALSHFIRTAKDLHLYQLVNGGCWNIKGAAEAVGDGILAPLLLEFGPAVLQGTRYFILHWPNTV